MTTYLVGAARLGVVFASAPVNADTGDARVNIGSLSCHEKGGWGFIPGASKALHRPLSHSGKVAYYEGSISKLGVDIGYPPSGVLLWEVVAPTDHDGTGSLMGHYGGVTAGATVGVGVDANALIGGSSTGIDLQPLRLQGNTGLNVAAGIAELTLHDRSGG